MKITKKELAVRILAAIWLMVLIGWIICYINDSDNIIPAALALTSLTITIQILVA